MKIIDKVERLLRDTPESRDSDKKLLLNYWQEQGLFLTFAQEATFMEKCTTPESITRARRALREKFPGSEPVEDSRYKKFIEYKDIQAVRWLKD